MTKTYEVEHLIHNLVRQYPTWPSTFSTCECQRHMARGGGKCAKCIEEDLGKIIDPEFASDIHSAIRHLATLKREALDLAGMVK